MSAYVDQVLEDGVYDIIVIDAELLTPPTAGGQVLRLDVTILAGAHKGEVVTMRAEGFEIDEVDALGMPGTLTVRDGEPSVALDR